MQKKQTEKFNKTYEKELKKEDAKTLNKNNLSKSSILTEFMSDIESKHSSNKSLNNSNRSKDSSSKKDQKNK